MAYLDFMEILEKTVQRENKLKEPPSRLLQRNVFTRINVPEVPWIEDPKYHGGRQMPDHLKHIKFAPRSHNKQLAIPEKDTSVFPIVHYWVPKVSSDEFTTLLDLNQKPSKADLLSVPHECEVVPDWIKRRVRIAAHDQEVVDMLIRKLERVQRIFKSGFESHMAYLVHIEDLTRFQLKMVPLAKQSTRVQHTLFDYESKWEKMFPFERIHTVRVLEFKPVPQKFMNVKVDTDELPNYGNRFFRAWNDYSYYRREPQWVPNTGSTNALVPHSQFGNMLPMRDIKPEDMLTQFFPNPATRTGSVVDSYSTPQISAYSTRQPITTRHTKNRIAPSHQEDDYNTNDSQVMDLSTERYHEMESDEGRDDSANGFGQSGFLDLGSRPSSVMEAEEPNANLTRRVPKGRKKAGLISEGLGFEDDGSGIYDQREVLDFGSRPPTIVGDEVPDANLTKRVPKGRKKAGLITDDSEASSQSASRDVQSENLRPGLFSLDRSDTPTESFMGSNGTERSSSTISLGECPTNDIVEGTQVRTSRKPKGRKPRKIIEEDNGDDDIVENLSGLSLGESGTRKMMNTMRQKAPGRAQAIVKDSDRLRRNNNLRINNDFSKTLEYVRSWRGELTLQAKVGMLMFKGLGRDAVRDNKEYNVWDVFINDEVKRNRSTSTHFTTAVTRERNDIEHIMNISVAGGSESLFNTMVQPTKAVSYEFYCATADGLRVVVVDAHTFEPENYSETQTFGITHIANPKQMWDGCIELSGRSVWPMTESLMTIVKSLQVTGIDGPTLKFYVTDPDLTINRVICKREARYPLDAPSITKGLDMELVITEVNELRCSQRAVDGHTQVKAFGKDYETMKEVGRLWYTVAIEPTVAKQVFSENLDLGVGDEVEWSTESFVGQGKNSVATTLTTALLAMLRKMDNVGYWNRQSPEQ
ncbi:hypothetical protein EX30DRAFT_44706 [Ascodesmis nigricans]|uniref:DUF7905 domain-containing protein n=1 Tax=Ascodesmis nigricans TaxID=341454 RepID=A0A4S2MWD2_9PEZI|nr:hypothetical protein EX30DRAFT_44706 [Ascodesmis nigricans]